MLDKIRTYILAVKKSRSMGCGMKVMEGEIKA